MTDSDLIGYLESVIKAYEGICENYRAVIRCLEQRATRSVLVPKDTLRTHGGKNGDFGPVSGSESAENEPLG